MLNVFQSGLQDRLNSSKLTYQQEITELQQTMDALHLQLQQVKIQLDETSGKNSRLELVVKEKSERFEELHQKFISIESELKVKVVLLIWLYIVLDQSSASVAEDSSTNLFMR